MVTHPFLTRRWLPGGRLRRRSHSPLLGGIALRCRARLRASALDARLAEGVDPVDSDELSARASQLQSPATRSRLAIGLLGAVETAHHPPGGLSAGVSIRQAQVLACESVLAGLAERLRDDGPLGVQGLAITSLLVSDGCGPLDHEGAPSLLGTAHAALVALTPPYVRQPRRSP
jgi:hypothetical protein